INGSPRRLWTKCGVKGLVLQRLPAHRSLRCIERVSRSRRSMLLDRPPFGYFPRSIEQSTLGAHRDINPRVAPPTGTPTMSLAVRIVARSEPIKTLQANNLFTEARGMDYLARVKLGKIDGRCRNHLGQGRNTHAAVTADLLCVRRGVALFFALR